MNSLYDTIIASGYTVVTKKNEDGTVFFFRDYDRKKPYDFRVLLYRDGHPELGGVLDPHEEFDLSLRINWENRDGAKTVSQYTLDNCYSNLEQAIVACAVLDATGRRPRISAEAKAFLNSEFARILTRGLNDEILIEIEKDPKGVHKRVSEADIL